MSAVFTGQQEISDEVVEIGCCGSSLRWINYFAGLTESFGFMIGILLLTKAIEVGLGWETKNVQTWLEVVFMFKVFLQIDAHPSRISTSPAASIKNLSLSPLS